MTAVVDVVSLTYIGGEVASILGTEANVKEVGVTSYIETDGPIVAAVGFPVEYPNVVNGVGVGTFVGPVVVKRDGSGVT